jgi:hypothetical protein
MSKRTIGFTLAAVGALLVVVAVSADAIGLSGDGSEGFGTRQVIGTVIGSVVLLGGLALALLARRGE